MVDFSGSYAKPRVGLGEAFIEYMADGLNGPEFVGLQVLPTLKSAIRAGFYPSIQRETILANPDANRDIGGDYNRVVVGAKDKTFTCKEYGLEIPVDDAEAAFYGNHGDFDSEAAAARVVARNLMVAYERRVAAAIQNTTTWTGAPLTTDVSGSAPWATVSSDIITTVLNAREKVRQNVGMYPNAVIMSAANLNNCLKNTGIRGQFTSWVLASREEIQRNLASIFGVQKVIVGGAVYNSAKEGQAFSGSDIWSQTYVMVAVVANDGDPLPTPCVGRTVLWEPDSPSELVLETYREERRRANIVRGRHQTAEQIHDAFFGHLLKVA